MLHDLKLPDKTLWPCSIHLFIWDLIKDYTKWMHGDKNKIEMGNYSQTEFVNSPSNKKATLKSGFL